MVSPTVSRRWLALEMKRLRFKAGLPQASVGSVLGCSVAKISYMENGVRLIDRWSLARLLELFEVPENERQPYLDEWANACKRSWWEDYVDLISESTIRYVGLEQGANRIRVYQPAIVPGLLQTPAYAKATFTNTKTDWSEEQIAAFVQIQTRRQQLLNVTAGRPDICVVLDEAAVRRVVGDRNTMAAQINHVVTLCDERDAITVQVVPFERGGGSEAMHGGFTILDFPFEMDRGLVCKENHAGAVFYDERRDLDFYASRFSELSEVALSPQDSLDLLRQSANDHSRQASSLVDEGYRPFNDGSREFDLFLSHATENKDFVEPLASALTERGVRVWYDDTEIRIGDSIRASIDLGLSRSRFGAVILSKAFFEKRWTSYELNGLLAREIQGHKVILPIWHPELQLHDLLGFSPSLADKRALVAADFTIAEIADELATLIRSAASTQPLPDTEDRPAFPANRSRASS